MTTDEMIIRLKATLKERRFNHTLGVASEAKRLAPRFGVDVEKAYIAGLLHDCAKNFTPEQVEDYCARYGVTLDPYSRKEPALIHAFLGATVARTDYGVNDPEILSAIYYHTTGKPDMTPMEKLIYIADLTEPGRDNDPGRSPEVSERLKSLVETDIDEALIYAIGYSLAYVLKKGNLIHPDSIFARNYLIENRRKELDR